MYFLIIYEVSYLFCTTNHEYPKNLHWQHYREQLKPFLTEILNFQTTKLCAQRFHLNRYMYEEKN